LDTRTKILTPGEAPCDAAQPLVVVTGYFDVLRAEHARELANIRQASGAKTLAALVLPLTGELMPIAARARMAAALRMVDYVITAENGEVDRLIAACSAAAVVRFESTDARLRTQLIEHAQRRQK